MLMRLKRGLFYTCLVLANSNLFNVCAFATHTSELIDFETLTQPAPFKEEKFIEYTDTGASSQSTPETMLRYFKGWPSFHRPKAHLSKERSSEDLKEEIKKLTALFYNQALDCITEDFQKAQLRQYFALALKPYEEFTYTTYRNAAQRSIKSLLFGNQQLKERVPPYVLYWTWKQRSHFNFYADSSSWRLLLEKAAVSHPQAQYRLGHLYEYGLEGATQDITTALDWYQKAASHNHLKAKLRLQYQALKAMDLTANDEDVWAFYREVAHQGFPYAQYLIKERDWVQSPLPRNWQQRIELLLEASNHSILEAQLKLAHLYEEGCGLPFETSEDWINALKQAQEWYDKAAYNGSKSAQQDSERMSQKIALIKDARGYILNKIKKGATVSFDPKHPLFDQFSAFIATLHHYSPGARYLGACIVQQLLETYAPEKKEEAKKVISSLLELVRSEGFIKHLKEEEPEAEQASKLFQVMVEKSQQAQESSVSKTKGSSMDLAAFLKDTKSFILRKIEKGIEDKVKEGKAYPLSPSHPLFDQCCEFIHHVSKYEGSVPEHGGHLIQQLLEFPLHSYQAKVLIEGLLKLVKSETFIKGKKGDTQEDMEDRRVEKLAKLNVAVEFTKTNRRLLSLKEIPSKLKVNKVMIQDLRISVYNYFFEQDEKPYNREVFDQAVESILAMYDRLKAESKITAEMLKDPEATPQTPEEEKIGSRTSLRNLLTNAEAFGTPLTNRFAHRLIKIAGILESGKLEEETLAAQLSAWAIAGLHCKTRSEIETHQFYIRNTTDGRTQESEEASLEVKTAIALAGLRRLLLDKLVPIYEVERIHQIAYLEKKAGKRLALIDPEICDDPHEKLVKERYKNMTPDLIKHLILKGDSTYKVNIEPGQGYDNPEVLIKHLQSTINDIKNPLITSSQLIDRFREHYGQEAIVRMQEYYGDDDELTTITSEGSRALLYSLGYLEQEAISKS